MLSPYPVRERADNPIGGQSPGERFIYFSSKPFQPSLKAKFIYCFFFFLFFFYFCSKVPVDPTHLFLVLSTTNLDIRYGTPNFQDKERPKKRTMNVRPLDASIITRLRIRVPLCTFSLGIILESDGWAILGWWSADLFSLVHLLHILRASLVGVASCDVTRSLTDTCPQYDEHRTAARHEYSICLS
jgi:hypothetical protein